MTGALNLFRNMDIHVISNVLIKALFISDKIQEVSVLIGQ